MPIMITKTMFKRAQTFGNFMQEKSKSYKVIDSVYKVIAAQSRGPEFGSPAHS